MRLQLRPSAAVTLAGIAIAGKVLLHHWPIAFAFAVLVMLSVVLHELGHAAVAHRYGASIKVIGLSAVGAYTIRDRSPRKIVELQTAVAGPLVNVILAGVCIFLVPGQVGGLLASCNLVLALTNLIPIAPSDGWRIWKLLFTA